jgi:ABC-type transporter Mla subunit MlaD
LERTIEFILQSQANFENRLEETSRQIAETSKQLQAYAETQTEFIQIVARHIEAQGEVNASLRAATARTDKRLDRTDERLDRLAETVERYISEGRNGKA